VDKAKKLPRSGKDDDTRRFGYDFHSRMFEAINGRLLDKLATAAVTSCIS
jgi:hypothetical protein